MNNLKVCTYEEGNETLAGSDSEVNVNQQLIVAPKSSEKKLFICQECPYKSSYKSNLMRHMRTSHRTAEGIVCNECGRTFSSNEQLDDHKRSHKRDYYCEVCGKKYGSKKGIRLHKKIVHEGAKPKYNCSICGKEFKEVSHYSGHINKHHGLTPFECLKCKKSFSYKSNLQRHLKTCDGEKQDFTCDICLSQFTSKASLKEHKIGRHDKIRQYACSCGEKFLWRSSLQKHRKNCSL